MAAAAVIPVADIRPQVRAAEADIQRQVLVAAAAAERRNEAEADRLTVAAVPHRTEEVVAAGTEDNRPTRAGV
jgi:hypothetical protein